MIKGENKNEWCVVKDEDGKHYRVRIRKLTPKECFRLMGVKDSDADKMLSAVSKSQCYKAAGNSIVVDQMLYLFESIIFPEEAMRRNLVNMARNASDLSTEEIVAMTEAMRSVLQKQSSASKKEGKDSPSPKEEKSRPRYIEVDMFADL